MLKKAFETVDRRLFVPEDLRDLASVDRALPIGFGQTISQPTTVDLMLGWLEVEPGDNVLDVGSGSGWTTALLAYLVGAKGRVYGVEIIEELLEFGRANCQKLNFHNVSFHPAGQVLGLPSQAPYQRILVSAEASHLPKELVDQLAVGGKLVVPVGNDIFEVEKRTEKKLDIIRHPGFIFVPLIHP